MSERLTYWRCPDCYGTGERIIYGTVVRCFKCDGTGNAMVDGERAHHERELERIKRAKGITAAVPDSSP